MKNDWKEVKEKIKNIWYENGEDWEIFNPDKAAEQTVELIKSLIEVPTNRLYIKCLRCGVDMGYLVNEKIHPAVYCNKCWELIK